MRRMAKTSLSVLGVLAIPFLMVQACSAAKSGSEHTSSADGATSGEPSTGFGSSGVGGLGTSGTSGQGGGCAETSAEAQEGALPADIVFVVDNSGSMTDEAVEVQKSMNDFSTIIINSGIDAHIILISADSGDDQGVCVPAPLGSGQCPNDENLPKLRHVVTEVGSTNGLQLVLSTYDQWKAQLRAGATKTIAIISDDDSAMGAMDFSNQMVQLDPTFKDFKFNAIVAPYELNPLSCTLGCQPPNCKQCDPCCGVDTQIGLFCLPLPANEGKVYKQLVNQTMGVLGDLCKQEFVPVFKDMATAVVNNAIVPCVYDIPPAPMGETIDFGKVNVEYKPNPNAMPQLIYNVPNAAACDANGGWYYDNPAMPTKIIFCDATCQLVQSTKEGSVNVKFGCATVIR